MTELTTIAICQQLLHTTLVYKKALQVHSVFESTINIIGEDMFFSIVSEKHCLYPMSCRIVSYTPFPDYEIEAGMSVVLSETDICFPQASLLIRLLPCEERDLSIGSVEGLSIPKDKIYKIDLLKRLIRESGCKYDLSTLITGEYSNPYVKVIEKRLPEFNTAVRKGDLRAAELAGELAGGGVGLTPSSDDLLIGYICVFLADAKAKDNPRFEKALELSQAMGNKAAERTNAISGAFLHQCGSGLFSEDMMKLLMTLYSNSTAETVRLCGQHILKLGSTSGTDMLTGVVLAMMNLIDE